MIVSMNRALIFFENSFPWGAKSVTMFFFLVIPFLSAVQIDLKKYNEWNIVQLAANFLPPDPIVVLAGAHQGDVMVQMAHQWPQGHIYAFEPNPVFHSALKQHKQWFSYVDFFSSALDSTTKKAPFFTSSNPKNPRIGSLLVANSNWKWHYNDATTFTVQCKNLQEWASEKRVTRIDFLWLNIGGSELRVLQSIPELIHSVQVIFVETHFEEFRQGIGLYKDLLPFLATYGFEEIIHWHIPNYQGYALFAKQNRQVSR